MNEILCKLKNTGRGGSLDKDGTVKSSALAFADDLLVLSDKDNTIPIQLDIIETFLTKSRLISGALVPGEGKIVPRTKPFIKHKSELIEMAHYFEPTKYL